MKDKFAHQVTGAAVVEPDLDVHLDQRAVVNQQLAGSPDYPVITSLTK
jgi:hypothetical protein